ncbi:hypothetical protein ACLOJK_024876 [Asimina triloba]
MIRNETLAATDVVQFTAGDKNAFGHCSPSRFCKALGKPKTPENRLLSGTGPAVSAKINGQESMLCHFHFIFRASLVSFRDVDLYLAVPKSGRGRQSASKRSIG